MLPEDVLVTLMRDSEIAVEAICVEFGDVFFCWVLDWAHLFCQVNSKLSSPTISKVSGECLLRITASGCPLASSYSILTCPKDPEIKG